MCGSRLMPAGLPNLDSQGWRESILKRSRSCTDFYGSAAKGTTSEAAETATEAAPEAKQSSLARRIHSLGDLAWLAQSQAQAGALDRTLHDSAASSSGRGGDSSGRGSPVLSTPPSSYEQLTLGPSPTGVLGGTGGGGTRSGTACRDLELMEQIDERCCATGCTQGCCSYASSCEMEDAPFSESAAPLISVDGGAARRQQQQQQQCEEEECDSAGPTGSSTPLDISLRSGCCGASAFSRLSVQQVPSAIGFSNSAPSPCGSPTAASSGGSPSMMSRESSWGVLNELSRRSSMDGSCGGHFPDTHAAEELFYRLNHARQTVDFVKRQATAFAQLSRAEMSVWEALELLNTLREYEAALMGDDTCDSEMSLLEHALQSAEACRLAFPGEDHMALAGLLHGLGKLLAHAKLGAEPQWAICGETFPVGCRFHPAVRHSQFFTANPDRRKRAYATPTGAYSQGCGLGSVCMSWGAGEYLYLVLRLNRAVALPPGALFCIRHQRFHSLFRPGAPYSELLSAEDKAMLPRLARFQEATSFRRGPLEGQLQGQALRDHYDALLCKYGLGGRLRW